jgi:hypothetical protein
MRKGKDPRGPKTKGFYGSGYGCGSGTLYLRIRVLRFKLLLGSRNPKVSNKTKYAQYQTDWLPVDFYYINH